MPSPKKKVTPKRVTISPKVTIKKTPKKNFVKNKTHPQTHGFNGYKEFHNNNNESHSFFGTSYIEHRNTHPFMGTNINGARKSRNVPENFTRHAYLPTFHIPLSQTRRRALNAETPRYISPLYNNSNIYNNSKGEIVTKIPFSKKGGKKKSIKKEI